MNKFVHKTSQMFGRTNKDVKINTKFQEDLWTVEVDRSQIEQVLFSLLFNSHDAMPGGGELYLQTENVTLDESFTEPDQLCTGKYVKISVTDTGVGIDEAIRERIFEPFFTTKRMGRGTGLSLASAYGIIKNHEGILNVYSERGEGTTFNICLPACEKKIIDEKKQEYIFGPVPSRRLGRALGVDLVPFKTCTYDCIYCQLGRTTHKTMQRKEWVPIDVVIDQLKAKLSSKPDYITLSGSGEPTLYSRLEELIFKIKEITNILIAVLNNGSLLWLPKVRNALKFADMVVPSLDAGSSQIFQYVNRPHTDITFSKMLQGLVEFRKDYGGQYWLEVFLLAGVTTPEMEINRLKTCINAIQPDKVQVITDRQQAITSAIQQASADDVVLIAGKGHEAYQIIGEVKKEFSDRHLVASLLGATLS